MAEIVLKCGMETTEKVEKILEKRYDRIPDDTIQEHIAQRKALAKSIKAMGAEARQRVGYKLAKPSLQCEGTEFDQHKELLNCANGTIDMRTGKLLPHNNENLLTLYAPIEYDPEEKCPFWEKHIERIFENNSGMVNFFQTAYGYTMSGLTTERKFFICYGKGANGKSVTFESLLAIFGKYVGVLNCQSLLEQKTPDQRRNEVMVLGPSRLVMVSEVGRLKTLDASTIKDYTGGDTITGREHYVNAHKYNIQFKLWLRCNHKPRIEDQDQAIWDRPLLIPFNAVIKRGVDGWLPGEVFKQKVYEERAGVLNWIIKGFQMYCEAGLNPPKEVIGETQSYREEQDEMADFIASYCIVGGEKWASNRDIYRAYNLYCKDIDINKPKSQKTISSMLLERGYHSRKSGDVRGFMGIEIDKTKIDLGAK